MNPTYTILRRENGGTLTEVATADTLHEAERLVESLKNLWPGTEYEIRETQPKSKAAGRP